MGMIEQKDIIADLHIHTLASIHAYSTLQECIREAKDHGMDYIAITDHYYNDGSELHRKNEVNYMVYIEEWANPNRFGVKVIGGAEFNINHELYKEKRLREKLHWRLLGTHSWFLDRRATSLDRLFEYFEAGSEKFNAFAHIERELHKIDNCRYGSEMHEDIKEFFQKMVVLAKEKNIYLEVNEGTLARKEPGAVERLEYWLRLAKENGNRISLGTDAHYCELIGGFRRSIALLNKVDFPMDRIINCNPDELDTLLPKKK